MRPARSEQRIVLRRLFGKHVERGAATWPLSSAVLQRCFVDQPAARAIDDANALLGLRQRLAVKDAAGLIGQRRMERDEVGARQQLVQRDLLDAELDRAIGRQERDRTPRPSSEAMGAVGDDRADVAAADQAERLARELDAHETVLLPLPDWVDWSACGISRASANSIAIACSAVVIELPTGCS